MPQNVCGNCENFRLHYIKMGSKNYFALRYGHCVKPRRKQRFADSPACAYWKEKEILRVTPKKIK